MPSHGTNTAKHANIGSMARASAINLGFAFVSIAVQLVLFGILGRILTPQDYGIFALANSILIYVAHLSQRGLTASLLRRNSLGTADYASAYVMCAILAVGSSTMVLATSLTIATLSPHLAEQASLLIFMTIPLSFQILGTPSQVYLQRDLSFFALNFIQLTSIIVGNGLVAISCATLGLGPWSLAFGGLGSAATSFCMLLVWGRGSLHANWNWSKVRTGLREALQFNAMRSLDISWVQAPTVILGAIGSPAAVGIYQRMQFLADLGMQLTVWRVTSVIYAALAQRHDGQGIDVERYRNVFTLCVLLVLPIVAFVLFSAENIIIVLLGSQWHDGATTLRLLIVAFGLSTINHAAGMALEHAGNIRPRLLQSLVAVLLVVALVLALYGFGPEYYALPAVISMAASTAIIHFAVGERWAGLMLLATRTVPGALLFAAVAVGSLLPQVIYTLLNTTPSAGMEVFAQFSLSLILCALCVPLLFRTAAMAPFVAAFASAFPRLYRRTRLLHRHMAREGI